ncbi:CapA family protein [Dactylosporangium sp. NBC_01737]|uniref:CapA family protein n=1 Tax=Dactylosporangium sp. NBC_01737 TaxID=2975959 RepID=UPI002E0E471D|nr:CapA family protein [Dactylosporangium sp. NBC_01737]
MRRTLAVLLCLVLAVPATGAPIHPHPHPARPAGAGGPGKPATSDRPSVGLLAAPARPADLSVVAAGDLFVQPALSQQAAADARSAGRTGHDFTQILAAVTPTVRQADLAICHIEQPLAPPEGPFTGYPIFSAPPQLADAAADSGFDTCSTASNHTLDYGEAGVRRTLDNLDRVRLRHTGSARTAEEAATPDVVNVRGVKIAQLSYTFSFNGLHRPTGKPWMANLIDVGQILAEARAARQAGAEIVILSLHWGTEYQNQPDRGQFGLARELLASPDIDLIIGMHVHVVQPFEKIGDKWVAYGLGNLLVRFADGSKENTQDSVVPRFTFTQVAPGRWRVTDVTVRAFFMRYYPQPRLVDVAAAGDAYGGVYRRIAGYVDLRGAVADGLRMVQ